MVHKTAVPKLANGRREFSDYEDAGGVTTTWPPVG
jgi:hypothetical protein